MRKIKVMIKSILVTIVTMTLACGVYLGNCWDVYAQEKTEYITGTLYQFGEKDGYDISSAETSSSTDSGTESDGMFCITGSITSVTEKNGFPAYAVSGGTLIFSYTYNDDLLKASEDEVHLIDDKSKKVNGKTLDSEIKKGALIVQTSKDGKIWYAVPGAEHTNMFNDNPDGLNGFYTTTDVQMVNGCYYRVFVIYSTAIRTQKAQKFPPKLEKYDYEKYAEVYSFYAYDETAIKTSVPESENRRNLGSMKRAISEGYVCPEGDTTIDNDDPHFGWDIGQFFVGGFTDYEDGTDGNPIFFKNNGDKLGLWFKLQQDIDKCYGNSAVTVVADKQGSDAHFEVPGGVNQTTDFGRGALIVKKINPDQTEEEPQIYTNYLEASASTDAITKVDLLEEGDYEVALDYAVKFDKTKILGKSILPETAKYQILFRFSVRNGNSMAFLFDSKTGSELSSGSITENGFRLDCANSQYLKVNVKREVLKDGFEGLTEDTRFNSVATDGDVFTDEGVYTITVTNRDLEDKDPTVKKVYVGTDNILKAYIVNNIPISDIKEKIALGATISDDGTIIEPKAEQVSEEPEIEENEEEQTVGESIEEKAVEAQDIEEATNDNSTQYDTGEEKEQEVGKTEGQTENSSGRRIIPILIAVVVAVAGVFLIKFRKKRSSDK